MDLIFELLQEPEYHLENPGMTAFRPRMPIEKQFGVPEYYLAASTVRPHCLNASTPQPSSQAPVLSSFFMDPLPRRRKEGGGEIVEVYGFAGWIASLVAYGEKISV